MIGCLTDPNRPVLVLEWCSRGSLEDVLVQDEIKLDWSFRLSLLTDLVRVSTLLSYLVLALGRMFESFPELVQDTVAPEHAKLHEQPRHTTSPLRNSKNAHH
jgi:hypothetical protein